MNNSDTLFELNRTIASINANSIPSQNKNAYLLFWLSFSSFLIICYPYFTAEIHFDEAWRLSFFSIYLTIFLFLRNRSFLNKIDFPFVLFILWWLLSIFCGFCMQRSFESVRWYILLSGTGILIMIMLSKLSYMELQYIIKTFFWGCAIVGIVNLATGANRAIEKALIEFNLNQIAFLNSFGIFLFPLVIRQEKKKIMKTMDLFALIVMATSIIQTASKKAFLIDITFYILLWASIHSLRNISLRKLILAILAVFLFWCVYHFFWEDSIMVERLQALYENYDADADLEHKYEGRGRFYVLGWKMFLNNPWGYGFDSYIEFSGDRLRAHSDYISVLVDSGFLGFMLYWGAYLYILLHLFAKAWKSPEKQDIETEVFFFGIFSMCLFALGRWNFQSLEAYLFLGLSWGMYKCKSSPKTEDKSLIDNPPSPQTISVS